MNARMTKARWDAIFGAMVFGLDHLEQMAEGSEADTREYELAQEGLAILMRKYASKTQGQ